MTETTFPFGSVDTVDGAAEAEETGANTRVLLLAGGVVAALVLAAGGYFLLGGSDPVEEAFEAPVAVAAAPAAPATQQLTTKPAALPVPFQDDLGRNPFKPLYVVPAPVAEPVAGAPTDPTLPGGAIPGAGSGAGSEPDSGPTQPDGPAVEAPAPAGAPGGGTGTGAAAPTSPDAPTAQEYTLVLKRVYGTGEDLTAEFTIDGRKVVAKVGVRFGPTSEIRLISVQEGPKAGQWTSVLQVGDGEPFDAITGEKVSVR